MKLILTETERKLTKSALDYLARQLGEDVSTHGPTTKWARAEIREQLIQLSSKFDPQ